LVGVGFVFSSFLYLGLPWKLLRWTYLTLKCIKDGPPRKYATKDASTQIDRDAGLVNQIAQTMLSQSWTQDIWVTLEGECYHNIDERRGVRLRVAPMKRYRLCSLCVSGPRSHHRAAPRWEWGAYFNG
jgi:hypothetical protein